MDFKYKCFKCLREFSEEKLIISHLKFDHFIRNNTEEMKCLLKGNSCPDVFFQYNQLKTHIKKCKNIQSYDHKTHSIDTDCSVSNLSEAMDKIEINNDVRISL